MFKDDIIIAYTEEIGNPDLFVGRKAELAYLFDWIKKVKKGLGRSIAIMSRKKKGKTALVQRFYNMLYTMNDPKVIPFYFKVREGKVTQLSFSETFYKSLLAQYFSFKLRDTSLINSVFSFDALKELAKNDRIILNDICGMEAIIAERKSDIAWEHARDAGHRIAGHKGEKIIQIIDEFQFLNEFIYKDEGCTQRIELASFYQSTAESKVSPQIITGSYVGWLTAIIRHMVARYDEYFLESFTNEEALEAVYNYSSMHEIEVTEESAAFIASICYNDPYYIARIFESRYDKKDLTSIESIIETMDFETRNLKGSIAKMWLEYIWDAVNRINDKNGKKIVLYLAKYGNEDKTKKQILEDLKLDMTEGELEDRLHKLVRADIISYGSTMTDFKGLGDKIFEIVFRKMYENDIEDVDREETKEELKNELRSLKGMISYYKGISAEYRVINLFLFASLKGVSLEKLVYNCKAGFKFGKYESMKKRKVQIDQERSIEIDILCEVATNGGTDFAIEVKNRKQEVTMEDVREFIEKKQQLEAIWDGKIGFIFYSEDGFSDEQARLLDESGIMYTDRLRFE